jgi:hypothetical protein
VPVPVIVGEAIVGDVARTTAPVPVTALIAVPAIWNALPVPAVLNVLLVNVSVVALPTNVSLLVAGNVRVFVPAVAVATTVVVPEVDPSNFTLVPIIEPVTVKEPVINVDPVIRTVCIREFTKEAVEANDAVLDCTPFKAVVATKAYEELKAHEELKAYEELTAHEELKAYEELTAHEEVPNKEPVIEPVTVKDPEMFTVFAAKSPFISGVPEPDAMYNLLLSSVFTEGPAPNPIAILFDELPEKLNPVFWPNAILLDPSLLVHKALNPIAIL